LTLRFGGRIVIKNNMDSTAALKNIRPNKGKNIEISVGGKTYFRFPIKTDIITERDNLVALLERYAGPVLEPGDILFISEKVVALTQGRIVPIADIRPSRLARFLARKVHNHYGTPDFRGFGHGTPMAMQVFIEEAGYPRVILAAAVSAITRPLGIKGLFYVISGKMAKSVDCPMSFLIQPYNMYAKRAPKDPAGVARMLKKKFGNDVVVVDANYQGVYSLGKSDRRLTEKFIYEVFRDNPAGQGDEMTPFFVVREKK